MSDLNRLTHELIESMNEKHNSNIPDPVRDFIEKVTFATPEDIVSALRGALSEDWMAMPVWARNLAYRLVCLHHPDDVELLHEAAADLLSFGPDWDEFAEDLKDRATQPRKEKTRTIHVTPWMHITTPGAGLNIDHENEGLELIYESGKLQERCDNCNATTQCDVSESLRGGKRRWDMECSCPTCGTLWHTGGPGASPTRIHQAIISANGESEIRLTDPDSHGARLLKALREVHDIPLAEAKRMADTLRSSGLRGTLVDVELLAGRLRESGFQVRVIRNGTAKQ